MALRQWRADVWHAKKAGSSTTNIPHPPVLPLLAAFVLAAERMGALDEVAPIAYYPRLFEVLGVEDPDERERLQQDFRRRSEEYWSALNEWLTTTNGAHGLPTAFATGHRYIGLPVSQALVRDVDRRRLPLMFERFGLPPGSDVSLDRMQHLLGLWINQSPSPMSAGLQRLWSRAQARPRIAEVAVRELAAWEEIPTGRGEQHQPGDDLLVSALIRPFPPRAELSMLVPAKGAEPECFQLVDDAGNHAVDALALPGGWVRPLTMSADNVESLLSGKLSAEDPDTRRRLTREPRDLVPLRRDPMLGMHVECERVPLGEDVILLVADEPPLVQTVVAQLEESARPGFTLLRPSGLPDGWVLIAGVVVLGQPARVELLHLRRPCPGRYDPTNPLGRDAPTRARPDVEQSAASDDQGRRRWRRFDRRVPSARGTRRRRRWWCVSLVG